MDKYSVTRYNKAPTVKHPRTQFDLSHEILTTFNTGDFVPVLCEHINPGETVALNYASLTRLETSLHQTMDNAYIEFAFFFVPDDILWTDFKKFEGENDDPWAQSNVYTIPQIMLKRGGSTSAVDVTPGSLLNHLMLPAGSYGDDNNDAYFEVEALSLRGVFQVFNDWYRDQNVDSIVSFSKASGSNSLNSSYTYNGASFAPHQQILKVNRLRDRFSTCLPAPQKGQEVTLSLGSVAPLVTQSTLYSFGDEHLRLTDANETPYSAWNLGLGSFDGVSNVPGIKANDGASFDHEIKKTNLVADLSNATAVTINQLRLAIVRQAMLERDARGGTRYNEIIQSRWDTSVNSLEIGRSEFLGGKRIPISMMEVLQTSETGTTVLGSDAGHSKTIDSSEGFVRSFTQHGVLLGFMYVRTARSYSQGISRKHFMKDYLDMPDPMLDNIGEIPVFKKELNVFAFDNINNRVEIGNKVFGYQEQYYWLKEEVNRFSGYFQPGINGTLDSWHYGDDYGTNEVYLSAPWMKETPDQVDRTIAVTSNAGFQFSANVHFDLKITRPFAKYSIPNTFGF